MSFSSQIEGNLIKTLKYLPYKYSIFFQKPISFSKADIQLNNSVGQKIYYLINTTEKKSALDYNYWEIKVLNQIISKNIKNDFETDFINLAVLTKNNLKKKKSLKLFYLRNIPRFSSDVADIIISN